MVWAKKNFRLIVMIATDNKVFWTELNDLCIKVGSDESYFNVS